MPYLILNAIKGSKQPKHWTWYGYIYMLTQMTIIPRHNELQSNKYLPPWKNCCGWPKFKWMKNDQKLFPNCHFLFFCNILYMRISEDTYRRFIIRNYELLETQLNSWLIQSFYYFKEINVFLEVLQIKTCYSIRYNGLRKSNKVLIKKLICWTITSDYERCLQMCNSNNSEEWIKIGRCLKDSKVEHN